MRGRRDLSHLPVIDPGARDPWRDRVAFFNGCCCRIEMLVIAHGLTDTTAGTGSLSRVNPLTSDVLWTADWGTDTTISPNHPRIFVSCDLDSRGNVYALWLRSSTSDGMLGGALGSGYPQGIVKFDADGNVLDSLDLPAMFSPYSGFSGAQFLPRVRVDPQDDARIYCGVGYDADEKLLYLFDAALAEVWAITRSDTAAIATPFESKQSTHGLVLDASGGFFTNASLVYQFDRDGALTDHDLLNAIKLFLNPAEGTLRAAVDDTPQIMQAYAAFPSVLASHNFNDWSTPEFGGTWGGTFVQQGHCGYSDGGRDVYFDFQGAAWTTSGGAAKVAYVFVTDDDGSCLFSSATKVQAIDVRRNPTTENVFAAGVHTGTDPLTGAATAGALAKVAVNQLGTAFTAEWVKRLQTTGGGAGGTGLDVAVRTVTIS